MSILLVVVEIEPAAGSDLRERCFRNSQIDLRPDDHARAKLRAGSAVSLDRKRCKREAKKKQTNGVAARNPCSHFFLNTRLMQPPCSRFAATSMTFMRLRATLRVSKNRTPNHTFPNVLGYLFKGFMGIWRSYGRSGKFLPDPGRKMGAGMTPE